MVGYVAPEPQNPGYIIRLLGHEEVPASPLEEEVVRYWAQSGTVHEGDLSVAERGALPDELSLQRPKREGRVVPAKPKRIIQGNLNLFFTGDVRHVIEIALWVSIFEVNGRRHYTMLHR
jgi:hypothetical protein